MTYNGINEMSNMMYVILIEIFNGKYSGGINWHNNNTQYTKNA